MFPKKKIKRNNYSYLRELKSHHSIIKYLYLYFSSTHKLRNSRHKMLDNDYL